MSTAWTAREATAFMLGLPGRVAVLALGYGLGTGLPAVAQGPVQGPATAFVNVSVIPMDRERLLSGQTVIVQGERIVALGSAEQVRVPTGAVRIDGRGKYLIPGLADCHTHLADRPGRDTGVNASDAEMRAWERDLFLYVANGVTTIRNMNKGIAAPEWLRMRDLASQGKLLSPRLYIGGSGRWPSGKGSGKGLDSIASVVAAFKTTGHDFIKISGEHGEVYDSVLAAARRLGIPAMGHVPVLPSMLEHALRSGQASFEHLTGYTEALLKEPVTLDKKSNVLSPLRILPESLAAQRQLIDWDKIPALAAATKRAGVWNCPTLRVIEMMSVEWRTDTISGWPELEYIAPDRRAVWLERARAKTAGSRWALDYTMLPLAEGNGMIEARRRLIKALQDSGAGVLLGTDDTGGLMSSALVHGVAVHRELQALVQAGLTPYQALVTGTRNIATFFGTLAETGTVAVGKRADLVLLRDNPLTDIRNTMQPAGVMLGGRWLDRAELDRRVAAFWAAAP